MKTIRDVVVGQDLVAVTADVPVLEAARAMTGRQIGAVPVIQDGGAIGIFTERDALTRVVAAGLDPARTTVREVMSTNLIVTDISESYEACVERMRQAHIRHVLVMNNGRLAGIVSMRDLMAIDLHDKTEMITQLNAYVHSVPADLWNRAV